MAIELRTLRYFVEVARAGSMSRAAAVLHIAQPALSRQMRKLEEEAGGLLFRRSPRGVEPTAAGRMLWDRADKLLADFASLSSELRQLAALPAGEIQLAISPGAGRMLASQLYARMQEALSGVVLQITEANTSEIDQGIRNGTFDVAVYPDPGASASLDRSPLVEERLFLVSQASDLGKAGITGQPITLQDLAKLPLLLPTSASLISRQLRQVESRNGIRFTTALTVTSVQIAKLMIQQTGGHTILGYSSIHEELRQGSLLARPIADPPLTRRFVWAVRRGGTGNPVVTSTLQQIVREEIDRLVRAGTWEAQILY